MQGVVAPTSAEGEIIPSPIGPCGEEGTRGPRAVSWVCPSQWEIWWWQEGSEGENAGLGSPSLGSIRIEGPSG